VIAGAGCTAACAGAARDGGGGLTGAARIAGLGAFAIAGLTVLVGAVAARMPGGGVVPLGLMLSGLIAADGCTPPEDGLPALKGAVVVGPTAAGFPAGPGCEVSAGAIAVAGLPAAGAFGPAVGVFGFAPAAGCVPVAGAVAVCGNGGPFLAPGRVWAAGATGLPGGAAVVLGATMADGAEEPVPVVFAPTAG